jgi:GTP diphosphokinase / guanosine-3',5'-bis(diphosphate) 3'-diphosphatase
MPPETEVVTSRAQYETLINRHFIPSQVRLVMLAYRFAKYAHRGQERDGGGRYFDHPREVSVMLLNQHIYDHELVIVALLHDVMEDSFILTWDDLEYIFGSRVCAIVKLVTKEQGMPKAAYLPRLLSGPPEAWLIKLADRLHNMNTLGSCSREKQIKQVKETREKILPICQKLAEEPRYAELGRWFAQELEAICNNYLTDSAPQQS